MLKSLVIKLNLIYLPVLVILLISGLVALDSPISPQILMSDPSAIGGIPWYAGILSMLGLVLWSGAVAVCMLSYHVLKNAGSRRDATFFLLAGCLSVLLLADDALSIHELVGPEYFGIPSLFFYVFYVLAASLFFVVFWDKLYTPNTIVLASAAVVLGVSVLIDVLVDEVKIYFYEAGFIEDSAKLLGIAGWLGYFAVMSVDHITRATGGTGPPHAPAQPKGSH